MPITEDAAARPAGRLLVDARGRLLARFQDESLAFRYVATSLNVLVPLAPAGP